MTAGHMVLHGSQSRFVRSAAVRCGADCLVPQVIQSRNHHQQSFNHRFQSLLIEVHGQAMSLLGLVLLSHPGCAGPPGPPDRRGIAGARVGGSHISGPASAHPAGMLSTEI